MAIIEALKPVPVKDVPYAGEITKVSSNLILAESNVKAAKTEAARMEAIRYLLRLRAERRNEARPRQRVYIEAAPKPKPIEI